MEEYFVIKKNSKIKKYINIITTPFRAIYATVAVAIWEVLSLGVLAPYITSLWQHAYDFLKLNEDCIED